MARTSKENAAQVRLKDTDLQAASATFGGKYIKIDMPEMITAEVGDRKGKTFLAVPVTAVYHGTSAKLEDLQFLPCAALPMIEAAHTIAPDRAVMVLSNDEKWAVKVKDDGKTCFIQVFHYETKGDGYFDCIFRLTAPSENFKMLQFFRETMMSFQEEINTTVIPSNHAESTAAPN